MFWAHPTAVVDEPTLIGEGTKIWHFCHVMPNARIGAGCVLGQNGYVGSRAVIGNGCKIQNNVSLYDEVILEDEVFVGPSAVFTNVTNPRSFVLRKDEYRRTVVGRGASIGANATIVCGHDIGPYAFVAAGAVVTRHVLPYALVAGVPARRIGWMCKCGVTLPKPKGKGGAKRTKQGTAITCLACGTRYREIGRGDKARLDPA